MLLTLTRSATGSTLYGDLLELVQVVSLADFVLTRVLGKRYSAFFVGGTYGAIGMALLVLFGLITRAARIGRRAEPRAEQHRLLVVLCEIVIGLSIYGQIAQAFSLRHLDAAGGQLHQLVRHAHHRRRRRSCCCTSIAPVGYAAGGLLAIALALALIPTRDKPIVGSELA